MFMSYKKLFIMYQQLCFQYANKYALLFKYFQSFPCLSKHYTRKFFCEIMWLIHLVIFLILRGSNGNLLEVDSDRDKVVLSYINHLINDLNARDSNTHDIAIFQLEQFGESKKQANDLIDDIIAAVSGSNPVLFPPTNVLVENRNLRDSSLTIIVSDITDNVRKELYLNFFVHV